MRKNGSTGSATSVIAPMFLRRDDVLDSGEFNRCRSMSICSSVSVTIVACRSASMKSAISRDPDDELQLTEQNVRFNDRLIHTSRHLHRNESHRINKDYN